MNKKLIILIALFISCAVRAQVAKWLIPPVYDAIHMARGADLVIADSLDWKVIWSTDGKRLGETPDLLFPFRDDLAVSVKKDGTISGLFNQFGQFVPLSGYKIASSNPHFSDGYLVVLEGQYYRYLNKLGATDQGLYLKALPFINGYASCTTYRNMQKQKDPYHLLLADGCKRVNLSYSGKDFDDDDIEFVSSVNDENVGIVVAKHKVYYFHGDNRTLSPVYATREANPKYQAKLENDLAACLLHDSESSYVLNARCGKAGDLQIRFDNNYVPISVISSTDQYVYKKRSENQPQISSPLKVIRESHQCGIDWDGQVILPPQLDAVTYCFNDKAFVKQAGKYGMLRMLRNAAFRISINKGNPIYFKHQKYETSIRLDLPSIISSADAKLEIDPKSGCTIDMTSGEKKDTEYGNYIQYNCSLKIPERLPDEMYNDSRNEICYPIRFIYEGLTSPMLYHTVKAWHYKYFNIEVNEPDIQIRNGELSFLFNVTAEREPGEPVYPTSITILTDSLDNELEKLSETRYKCKVFNLKEGINNIFVQVLEEGCPPVSFPLEIAYTKPPTRTNSRSVAKEKVAIKKKLQKAQSAPVITPHLDM